MGNSKNIHSINVSIRTYNRLSALKKEDDTFNDVVKSLLDMEDKYNFKEESIEFEYITQTNLKMFKVVYSEKKVQIEYFNNNNKKFEPKISAWDSYITISEEEKDEFLKFILKESNQVLLKNMGNELVYDNFIIHRVGNI